MKYIRTKDGIYYNQTYFYSHKEEIIKQADTIEELCDEYVLESEDHKGHLLLHNIIELDNEIFDGVKTLKEHHQCIYGAIWTDKGLIYVAKMNEKGELELI